MHYSKVVSSTLNSLWKNKKLWLVSLVASLPANLLNYIYFAFYNSIAIYYFSSAIKGENSKNFESKELIDLFVNGGVELLIILFALFLLGMIICSLYFSLTAKALMFKASKSYYMNLSERVNYRKLWNISSKHWFGLFKGGLITYILIFIFVFPILFISILMNFVGENAVLSLLLLLFYCVLYIPTLLSIVFITLLSEFTYRGVVLKKQNTLQAFKDAFVTIKKNFWKVVLSYLIFYGISIVLCMLYLIILAVILLIDFVISVLFGSLILSGGYLYLLILLVTSIVIWLFAVTISSPIWAFYEIYWTNVYLELNKHIKND
ncbi:hypothetical protein KBD45_04510 [Candidatus Dojkabacteria bacterium]|nr:hypothetical protein [Candidatus Dojkabacteria bacterium]